MVTDTVLDVLNYICLFTIEQCFCSDILAASAATGTFSLPISFITILSVFRNRVDPHIVDSPGSGSSSNTDGFRSQEMDKNKPFFTLTLIPHFSKILNNGSGTL